MSGLIWIQTDGIPWLKIGSFGSSHFDSYYSLQGLNPGLAIGEMKKMLALYNAKEAKTKAHAQ